MLCQLAHVIDIYFLKKPFIFVKEKTEEVYNSGDSGGEVDPGMVVGVSRNERLIGRDVPSPLMRTRLQFVVVSLILLVALSVCCYLAWSRKRTPGGAGGGGAESGAWSAGPAPGLDRVRAPYTAAIHNSDFLVRPCAVFSFKRRDTGTVWYSTRVNIYFYVSKQNGAGIPSSSVLNVKQSCAQFGERIRLGRKKSRGKEQFVLP